MRPRFRSLMMLLLAGACGCTHLRLQQTIVLGPGDWTMEGGGPGRANLASANVQPPLHPAWKYDAGAGFGPSSAIVAGTVLLLTTMQGEVHAVDVTTGERIGAVDFGTAITGAPAIEDQNLFVALTRSERNVLCYDLSRGRIAWRVNVADVESSPLLMHGRLYVSTLRGSLLCLDTHDGATIWTYTLPRAGNVRNIRASPAGSDSLVVVATDRGEVFAISREGTLRWMTNVGGTIFATPGIAGTRAIIGSLDGKLSALDAATGTLLWHTQLGSKLYGSPAIDSQYVVVGTSGGSVFCLHLNDGSVFWEFRTKSVVDAAPVISGDLVFVGGLDKSVHVLCRSTGKEIWSAQLEGRIKTSPIITTGYLLVFCDDRTVQAFREMK